MSTARRRVAAAVHKRAPHDGTEIRTHSYRTQLLCTYRLPRNACHHRKAGARLHGAGCDARRQLQGRVALRLCREVRRGVLLPAGLHVRVPGALLPRRGSRFLQPPRLRSRRTRPAPDGDHRLLGPREGVQGPERGGVLLRAARVVACARRRRCARPLVSRLHHTAPAPLLRLFSHAAQLVGISVDSHFSHLAWSTTARDKGGLGGCAFPLVADICKTISKDYGGAALPFGAVEPGCCILTAPLRRSRQS